MWDVRHLILLQENAYVCMCALCSLYGCYKSLSPLVSAFTAAYEDW